MTMVIVKGRWKKFFSEFRSRLDKRNENQLSKESSKREEIIGILQKRYGYTKEKAEAEMSAHYKDIILG